MSGSFPRSVASALLMLPIGLLGTHAPERSGTGDDVRPVGGPRGRKFFKEKRFAGGPIGAVLWAAGPEEVRTIAASTQARRNKG